MPHDIDGIGRWAGHLPHQASDESEAAVHTSHGCAPEISHVGLCRCGAKIQLKIHSLIKLVQIMHIHG